MTDDWLRLACQTFLTVHPMGEAIEADWNMERELTAEVFFFPCHLQRNRI